MCQANLPGHWIESAPTGAERARRKAALDRLAVVRDGYRVYDGPAVLDLIRQWNRRFQWSPDGDRGCLVSDSEGRLVESSEVCRAFLTP